jgi:hypothetical protein
VQVLFEKSTDPHWQIGHSQYFFTVKVNCNQCLTNQLILVKIIQLEQNVLLGKLL